MVREERPGPFYLIYTLSQVLGPTEPSWSKTRADV